VSLFAISWRVVSLLGCLVLFVPAGTSDLGSRPHPLATYEQAVALAEWQRLADSLIVATGGEPLLFVHGHRTARVIVLLHGFTNAPRQFRPLAQQLYEEGNNVYVPRMPHHSERGKNIAALSRTTAPELRDCADSAVDIASALGDSVIVVGLSMGGTMAAWVGVFRPTVRRVLIIAPLLALARVPDLLQAPAMNLALRFPNVNAADPPDSSRPDRDPGLSSHAIGEILRLGAAVERAPDRNAPHPDVAVLLNANDHTIANGPVRDLARRWAHDGSSVVIVVLPDSLRLPHDVIDVTNPRGNPCVVYPIVTALIYGHSLLRGGGAADASSMARACP
jgi:carboxylesterase